MYKNIMVSDSTKYFMLLKSLHQKKKLFFVNDNPSFVPSHVHTLSEQFEFPQKPLQENRSKIILNKQPKAVFQKVFLKHFKQWFEEKKKALALLVTNFPFIYSMQIKHYFNTFLNPNEIS